MWKYVDDLLVKSKDSEAHAKDLREDFAILQKYRMKLNPVKYAFGVPLAQSMRYRGWQEESWYSIGLSPNQLTSVRHSSKCYGRTMKWNDDCEEAFA